MSRHLAIAAGIALWAVAAFAAEPNLLVDLSHPLANAAIAQSLNQPQCINEKRQGLLIQGIAQVSGNVSLRFNPNANWADLTLVVDGFVSSQTVATKGPVQVQNAARIPYRATKPLGVNGERMYTGPAQGCADAELDLLCVSTRLRGPLDTLVRRVATKVYHRHEDEAVRDLIRETSQRVATEFDKSANPELAKADQSYREKLLGKMREQGILPQELHFSTTADQLLGRARLSSTAPDDWGAAAPPVTGRPDLALRVHQSFPNTSLATLLAGKTLTDEDFNKMFGSATVKPPPEEQDKFSVTFAKLEPFQTTFANGQVLALIRTRGFTSGDTVYEDPYDVTVRYDLTPSVEGLALVRQELRLRDPAGQPLAGRTFTISRLLARRLEKALPERIKLDPLELPDALKKAGPLRATQGASDNGWLTLAWRREIP